MWEPGPRRRRQDALFTELFDHSPVGIAVADERGDFVEVNAAWCRLLGREREELLGRSSRAFTHPDDLESHARAGALIDDSPDGVAQVEKRFVRPDGSTRWVLMTFSSIDGPEQQDWTVAHAQDITRRKATEQALEVSRVELQLLATTDPLTGCLNRRSWDDQVSALINAAATSGEPLTLGVVDFDGFKPFNDRHGHAAGDTVLVDFARHTAATLGPDDVLARWGGDEFAVALPGTDRMTATATLAGRLGRELPLGLSCSVGLAQWRPGETAAACLSRADRRLYRAKAARSDTSMLLGDGVVQDGGVVDAGTGEVGAEDGDPDAPELAGNG